MKCYGIQNNCIETRMYFDNLSTTRKKPNKPANQQTREKKKFNLQNEMHTHKFVINADMRKGTVRGNFDGLRKF